VYAAIASFCPDFKEEGVESNLRMKILVDCSGSMKGDSISQAQEALHELSLKLTEADQITYSKFGSNVIHMNDKLENCTNSYLKNYLAKVIHETDADMGGTELNAALTSTFKLSFSQSFSEGCDVLLITDGDVWDIEEITLQAKRTNHRIFAIGVGSAPAESLLKDLAEITGGACDLVSPNEGISSSVLRMIARMKAQRTTSVTIDWGQKPSWQSNLSKQLFANETRHVYAILKTKPAQPAVISWETASSKFNSQPSQIDWPNAGLVPRLVAGAELQVSTEEKYASDIALKYQLISNYTNLILVQVRDEQDKAEGIPRLQKIRQMQAAGQGGFGTVLQNISYMMSSVHDSSVNVPSVFRTRRVDGSASALFASIQDSENYEIPAFLRKPEESSAAERKATKNFLITPKELIEKINGLATSTQSFEEIVSALDLENKLEIISSLCLRIVSDDQSRFASGLAYLISYIDGHINSTPMLIRHAERLLRLSASKLSTQEESQAAEIIKSFLPELKPEDWGRTVSNEQSGVLARAIGFFRKKEKTY
jgi:Ca-activated chloride channel family protein